MCFKLCHCSSGYMFRVVVLLDCAPSHSLKSFAGSNRFSSRFAQNFTPSISPSTLQKQTSLHHVAANTMIQSTFRFVERTTSTCPINTFSPLSWESQQLFQSYHGPLGFSSD
ncbi:hypothetical protein AMECASPLE_014841 [Ameca splendens]|uniref:Uncharacterized protein n=1 Tax=Ameca splendens TaxID=208324 RepID=A0ABV0ZYZ4_9TELE